MKSVRFIIAAALLSLLALPFKAFAVTAYDQNVTAIFGSGNPNGGWATDTENNLTLALRAKGRNDTAYAGTTPNGGTSTYTFATQQGARGAFNYEFSIAVNGNATLSDFNFFLSVDQDHSAAFVPITINPITKWADNSYGTGATGNGAGTETGMFSGATVAQNSQNIMFGDYPGGPLAVLPDGTYTYNLFATALTDGPDGVRLANISIDVIVGNGRGPAVPDSGSTVAMLLAGLTCMGVVSRSFHKKAV